jgi:CRP-like cAMP-binding protein
MNQKRSSVRDILAQESLLEYVPPVEIDRLAANATTSRYETEQYIFRKGDPGRGVMSIVSGRVRVSTRSAENREVVLAVIGPGEILGEIATIDGGERTADAVAMEPTEVLFIGRTEFLGFLERNPQACLRLLEILCDRFRWTDEIVSDLNIFNLRPRLAKRLLSLSDQYGEPDDDGTRFVIRLPEETLARMMGSTQEAVRRQLRSWTEIGLIRLETDCVVVRSREGLERVVRKLSPRINRD